MSSIKNPVQIVTRKITTPNQVVNIEYPVIISNPTSYATQKMNKAILDLVNTLIKDQGYYENNLITVMGWYEIKNNQRGILSLTIGNYSYAYHAAHGMTIIKALTFDVETGKAYELEELFKLGSDYVKVLSDIVRVQIKEREIDTLEDFKSISPNQDYYIADKSLIIYFQLYELAAYVYGFLFFPISVYDIQNIIKDGGPLGIMAINN